MAANDKFMIGEKYKWQYVMAVVDVAHSLELGVSYVIAVRTRRYRVFLKSLLLSFCTRISRKPRKGAFFLRFFSVQLSKIRGIRVLKNL